MVAVETTMPRYTVTAAVTWEIETDIESKAREKLHELAGEQFERCLYSPAGMGIKWRISSSQLIKETEEPASSVLGTFETEEVFPYVQPGAARREFVCGDKTFIVKMNSDRYRLFKENPRCVCCGLLGTKMRLEVTRGSTAPHFNMYGVGERGEFILMTKDHTQPKSKGGKNKLENYATMCQHCNGIKSDACITWEQVKKLRDLRDSLPTMKPKARNKLIAAERERMAAENRKEREWTEEELVKMTTIPMPSTA